MSITLNIWFTVIYRNISKIKKIKKLNNATNLKRLIYRKYIKKNLSDINKSFNSMLT